MNDYNGFITVDDPMEYLNAPAMIMNDVSASPPATPSFQQLPLILQAAVDYSQNFRTLSADELQTYYAEQSDLAERLRELASRIEIEYKMREAASSISKLQAGDRSSVISTKSTKRFSKLLGGQDTPSKSDKRLSKQAADEMLLSTDKINDMELAHLEIERRKTKIDKIILEHHSSVLAKAIVGKPMPNHRRNLSANSAMSNLTTNTQGSRRSWIVAPRHQRQISTVSNSDSISLATVNEHPPLMRPVAQRPEGSDPELVSFKRQHTEELNNLAVKVSRITGDQVPAYADQAAFIGDAFESLHQSFMATRQSLQLSQLQVDNSQTEIAALKRELLEKSMPSTRNLPNASSDKLSENVSKLNLQHELAAEQSKYQKLKEQLESQRTQLVNTTKSLEDVTRLSIQLETEQSQLTQLLPKLHEKIADLEQQRASHLNDRLAATSNTSKLCQEYQKIVADLLARHAAEVRALYPVAVTRSQLLAGARNTASVEPAKVDPEPDGESLTQTQPLMTNIQPDAVAEDEPNLNKDHSDDMADLRPPNRFDPGDDSHSSYDLSYEDSIQLTDDESASRTKLNRVDTSASGRSKSSSLYPEAYSRGPSRTDLTGNQTNNNTLRETGSDDDELL